MAYIKIEHNINTEDYSEEYLVEIIKQIKILEDLIKETKNKEIEMISIDEIINSGY